MADNEFASRRGVLKAGLTVLAGATVATAARADDAADGKVDKSVVQYQYKWNTDGSHCAICANYIDPGQCKVVAGKIDPNGYCIAFAAKDSK